MSTTDEQRLREALAEKLRDVHWNNAEEPWIAVADAAIDALAQQAPTPAEPVDARDALTFEWAAKVLHIPLSDECGPDDFSAYNRERVSCVLSGARAVLDAALTRQAAAPAKTKDAP